MDRWRKNKLTFFLTAIQLLNNWKKWNNQTTHAQFVYTAFTFRIVQNCICLSSIALFMHFSSSFMFFYGVFYCRHLLLTAKKEFQCTEKLLLYCKHDNKHFVSWRKQHQVRKFWRQTVQGQVERTSTPSPVNNSTWSEVQSSWNKTPVVERKGWREGAARDGGGWGLVGLSLLGELFCLYYIPSVSRYSLVPVPTERGLTTEVKERAAEKERPSREYRVTKDLLHPCPETSFSSKNNTFRRKKKWSEIGRARWGWGEGEREVEDWWHSKEKYREEEKT